MPHRSKDCRVPAKQGFCINDIELGIIWQRYSKPESRFGYSYTSASQERQAAMIREELQGLPGNANLHRERAVWTALVVQYGVLEGTFRLLEIVTQNQGLEVAGAERYQIESDQNMEGLGGNTNEFLQKAHSAKTRSGAKTRSKNTTLSKFTQSTRTPAIRYCK